MKICQCWDDGVVDDIRLIEILRENDAKASFNLNPGTQPTRRKLDGKYRDLKEVWKLGQDELTAVYDGFLVANHTATHPHLTQIAPEEAARDIREGREMLEQLFGYAVTGFAYPFGEENEAVREMVGAAGHFYARTVGAVDDCFPPADAMAFHPNCHFMAADFWEKFEHAKVVDGVFYFRGHSFELITEEQWQELARKIARLSAEPTAKWVDLPELFSGTEN